MDYRCSTLRYHKISSYRPCNYSHVHCVPAANYLNKAAKIIIIRLVIFYFNRLPRLWNALPPINLNLPIYLIKSQLKFFLWNHFLLNFDSNNYCTYHFLCPCNSCMLNKNTQGAKKARPIRSSSYQVDSYTCD